MPYPHNEMLRAAPLYVLAASSLCACPQLLDDEFTAAPGPSSGGSAAGSPASGQIDGGARSPDAGSGGRGGAQADGGSGGSDDAGPHPQGSCHDSIRNAGEQGIDCGGVCPACPCASFGPFSTPELLGVDIAGDENGPALSADRLTLYFSAQGDSSEDIFFATRATPSSAFSTPEPLASVNSAALDGSPALASDGSALFLFSDRAGGPGNRDLWVALFDAAAGSFRPPTLLANVNSPELDLSPAPSHDGKDLWFISARPGGSGGSDIWQAQRLGGTGEFTGPVARFDLSSAERDEGIAASRDGLSVVFSSDRGVDSSMDLWAASRPTLDAPFEAAVPLTQLNTSSDELDPDLSADGRELVFVSTRQTGNRRLWHATRDCE